MQRVAKITRQFGVEGGLIISLYDTYPKSHDLQEPLFAKIEGLDVPLYLDHFERHGASGAKVQFADIDTPRRAEELLGMELHIPFDAEAEIDMSFESLVGFKVVIQEEAGELISFIDNTMNPLFEVRIGGEDRLIPAVEEFIESVSVEERTIWFNLPEGLMDL